MTTTTDQCSEGQRPIYVKCISCAMPFTDMNVFTRDGWAETQISGMCEKCFDDLFEGMEEE